MFTRILRNNLKTSPYIIAILSILSDILVFQNIAITVDLKIMTLSYIVEIIECLKNNKEKWNTGKEIISI